MLHAPRDVRIIAAQDMLVLIMERKHKTSIHFYRNHICSRERNREGVNESSWRYKIIICKI